MAEWFDQFDQELKLWHREAGLEYQEATGAVVAALGDTFDEWEANLILRRFTLEDAPALFVVADESTALVIQLLPDGATVHFLGSIAGGTYVETTRYREREIGVDGVYSHKHLPGGKVSVERVSTQGSRRPMTVQSDQRAERLQTLFREWAEQPGLGSEG